MVWQEDDETYCMDCRFWSTAGISINGAAKSDMYAGDQFQDYPDTDCPEDKIEIGRCCRFPPQFRGDNLTSKQPLTLSVDFCGEFRSEPGATDVGERK